MRLSPVSAGFRRLAHLRHARGFHPDGRVGRGLLVLEPGDSALGRVLGAADHAVTVRLSRGIGLPSRFPDILGLAVRVDRGDEPLDLLFSTTVGGRWGRCVLLPASTWTQRTYSTVLPYASDDPETGEHGHTLIALSPAHDSLPDATLETLDTVDAQHPLAFDVEESQGGWHTVGRLIVQDFGGDERLAFDPMLHADRHLRPVRPLSAVREAAYRGSRRGRAE
jgi:hypothetical protein